MPDRHSVLPEGFGAGSFPAFTVANAHREGRFRRVRLLFALLRKPPALGRPTCTNAPFQKGRKSRVYSSLPLFANRKRYSAPRPVCENSGAEAASAVPGRGERARVLANRRQRAGRRRGCGDTRRRAGGGLFAQAICLQRLARNRAVPQIVFPAQTHADSLLKRDPPCTAGRCFIYYAKNSPPAAPRRSVPGFTHRRAASQRVALPGGSPWPFPRGAGVAMRPRHRRAFAGKKRVLFVLAHPVHPCTRGAASWR
jgi:hypothetical protein